MRLRKLSNYFSLKRYKKDRLRKLSNYFLRKRYKKDRLRKLSNYFLRKRYKKDMFAQIILQETIKSFINSHNYIRIQMVNEV